MSAAASSLYRGGRFYQMLHGGRTHDIPHYLALLEDAPNARVLELGVGAGRVALPMAAAGAQLCGVDESEDMLALLRAALEKVETAVAARVTWVHADLRSLRLPQRFELVTCPFNGVGHQQTNEQLAAFFACARHHLAPGGRLAFDVLKPDPQLLAGHRHDVPWFRHPDDGSPCRWTQTIRYDADGQLLHIEGSVRFMTGERPPEVRTLVLRQFFATEMETLLQRHGFAPVRPADDLGDVLAYSCQPV